MNHMPTELTGSAADSHVLVVADWMSDPASVIAACTHQQPQPASFTFLVPALLHGLDWFGDPYASVSCAHRALAQVEQLAERAGLPVESAEVGDPDPIAAILDVALDRRFDDLLICVANPHSPLGSLAARAYRATGIPAETRPVRRAASARTRRRFGVRNMFKGYCQLEPSPAA